MFNIKEELKKLPHLPGVYIMYDKNNKIIYVGKAISLKNRVSSYFQKNNKTKRIENMVSLIDHFEYIIVNNEQEALILECNLIKENMPKFNVLLKDDKTYPFIKINVQDDYPDITVVRRKLNDGAKYFGPYSSSSSAKETVDFIKDKFLIRRCKKFRHKDRACLDYFIKKCSGPCMNYISKEDYNFGIKQIVSILNGNTDSVIKELKLKMKEASDNLEFEKAAKYRNEILATENISQKQVVSNISENDIDVIGIAKHKNYSEICVQVFFVRNSKIIGRENYFFNELYDEKNSEILSEFLKQYYMNNSNIPSKIMVREDFLDREIIENWIASISNKKIKIKIPKIGEKLKLVEMAEKNAEITLINKYKKNNDLMLELKKVLNLEKLPKRIETYDISNISGEFMVSSMCVMIDGVIKKGLSRNFKIKTIFEQNDPAAIKETVERRLERTINGDIKAFGELPSIILVDGGITQIRATKLAINTVERNHNINIDIEVFGMVKNDKHQTRALINEDGAEFDISEELFNLITEFQNTVHNTVITYHRKLRDKTMQKSALDDIVGIGEIKKQRLLKKFGSINRIKNSSINELMEVEGISEEIARKLKGEL